MASVTYQSAWLKGVKAAWYEGATGGSEPTGDAVAMAMGQATGPGAIDTATEKRGFKAGVEYGMLLRTAYNAGMFPDLENALAGGNEIQRATATAVDFATDVASDPVGELGDLFGLSF